jgi:hypothetical protein
VKQWKAGTDDLTDLQISGFKTTSDILHEIEKMYQGETRFTMKMAAYLAKAAASSPSIAKEAEQYDVIFPYPAGPEAPDDIGTAKAFLKGSYETFHQYIDKIVALLPEQSRQRISLTSEQYHAEMTIVRKVDTGELPDKDLVDAANLIKRMVQDYEAPDPRGPIAEPSEEEQQRILAKWNNLLLRVEKSRVAQ